MENKNKRGNLLEEFPFPKVEQWLELVEKQLKGVPFEKKLVNKGVDNIPIQPIYRQESMENLSVNAEYPGCFPYLRGSNWSGFASRGWEVSQRLLYVEAKEMNQSLKNDIPRGLNSIYLILDEAGRKGVDPDISREADIGKDGMSIFCRSDLDSVFKDIDIQNLTFQLDADLSAFPFVSLFLAYVKSTKLPFTGLKGSLVFDPLSSFAKRGLLGDSLDDLYSEMADLCHWSSQNAPQFRMLGIDTRPYYESGGSTVQELAFSIATAVEYLRELLNRGLTLNEAVSNISFFFSIGSDFFKEISKFRAARVLWASVVTAFGGEQSEAKAKLYGCSSNWNKTLYDPYVNVLRSTTEAFSAIIGGCDNLDIMAFDSPMGLPNDLSRRIARNIQIILKEECHGDKIIDPAGGSWYVESLSDELGKKAWKLFQEIEKNGGMRNALATGMIQKSVADIAEKKLNLIENRKRVIVGTNMYPNLDEKNPRFNPPDVKTFCPQRQKEAEQFKMRRSQSNKKQCLAKIERSESMSLSTERVAWAIEAVENGASLGELSSALKRAEGETAILALHPLRRSSRYEELRNRASDYLRENGTLPTVFLANIGTLGQYKARADFVTGFVSPGGFLALSNNGFKSVAEAAKGAVESGSRVTVICSTDDLYEEVVPEFCKLVRSKDSEMMILLAGYPKSMIEAFKKAGINDFIHLKANNYRLLKKLQERTGV